MTPLDSHGRPIRCALFGCNRTVKRGGNGKPLKYCDKHPRRHHRKAKKNKEMEKTVQVSHEELNRRYREARGLCA
jgi:transposase-like protein